MKTNYLLILCTALFVLLSCQKDDDTQSILGKWKEVKVERYDNYGELIKIENADEYIIYNFNADNTIEVLDVEDLENGTWKQKGDKVTIILEYYDTELKETITEKIIWEKTSEGYKSTWHDEFAYWVSYYEKI